MSESDPSGRGAIILCCCVCDDIDGEEGVVITVNWAGHYLINGSKFSRASF